MPARVCFRWLIVLAVLLGAAPAAAQSMARPTPFPARVVTTLPRGGYQVMRTSFGPDNRVQRQITSSYRANGTRARQYYTGPLRGDARAPYAHVDRQYNSVGALRRVTLMRFDARGNRLSTTRTRIGRDGSARTTTRVHTPPAGIPTAR